MCLLMTEMETGCKSTNSINTASHSNFRSLGERLVTAQRQCMRVKEPRAGLRRRFKVHDDGTCAVLLIGDVRKDLMLEGIAEMVWLAWLAPVLVLRKAP